ncbi:MAG: DUF177 domain-containing protein [Dehalococcoidia bacterium]|nr:MAG: DUF177 domain-containing protein [Dehalococcoidia bacterium]
MRINVSQQLKEPIGSVRNYEVSEAVDIAGGSCLVQGEVRLTRTNRGILATAKLHTGVEVTCSRCLGLFSCPLSLDIEEEYFPTTDVVSGASLPLPEEPEWFTIDEHHILDLTEAIRQYALLAIPMKLICREDCAGLCPICGHDLNQGPCGCVPQGAGSDQSKLDKLA